MSDKLLSHHPLESFASIDLEFNNEIKTVFHKGEGPGIILMHEVPCLHTGIIRFAETLVQQGFSVWMPSLFGTPGREPSLGYIAKQMAKVCIMKEFTLFAKGSNSPVTIWLRQLANHVHMIQGGPGVGAIGMCLTGGFALNMMLEPAVIAPVVCNPSLPFALTPSRKKDVGIDSKNLHVIQDRAVTENMCVLGLRFTNDIAVPEERFVTLKNLLQDHFLAIEIDSSFGNDAGVSPFSHSVLGAHYKNEPNHPTVQAEKKTIQFFKDRLLSKKDTTEIENQNNNGCERMNNQRDTQSQILNRC